MKIRAWHIAWVSAALLSVMTACSSTRHTSRRSARTHQTSHKVSKPAHHPHIRPISPNAPVGTRIVAEARTWLGVPYAYGGATRDGADCSGFIQQVYYDASGITLPRTTAQQMEHCTPVERESLVPGDILFFKSRNSEGKVAHVGIYSGEGRMIHASSSRGVVEDDLSMDYYIAHYVGAGRSPLISGAVPRPITQDSIPAPETVAPPGDTVAAISADTIPDSPEDVVRRAFMSTTKTAGESLP